MDEAKAAWKSVRKNGGSNGCEAGAARKAAELEVVELA